MAGHSFEDDVVLLAVERPVCLEGLVLFIFHDANPKYELLGVVITANDVDVSAGPGAFACETTATSPPDARERALGFARTRALKRS